MAPDPLVQVFGSHVTSGAVEKKIDFSTQR